MNSLRGHFLVAAPHQLDPNFFHTVILVVEHTDRGAFGVIVNCLREDAGTIDAHKVRRFSPLTVQPHFGGPVTGPLMALHRKASLGGIQLLPEVFFSAKESQVLALIRHAEHPLKVFAGYAGWAAAQLDYEVEQGVWRVIAATPEQVFSDHRDLWQQLSRQASCLQLRRMFHLKHIPANPLLN
jgi:putative transcriptional regulator